MLDGENYTIEVGQDPLNDNKENNMNQTLSSFDGFSTPPQIVTSSTSVSSSESSSSILIHKEVCGRKERRFSLLNPLSWFRSEQMVPKDEEKEESKLSENGDLLLIAEIMEHFKNNDNDGMQEFLEDKKVSEEFRSAPKHDYVECSNDTSFSFSDEYIDDDCIEVFDQIPRNVVPPILAKKRHIPSRVLKSVRFEMDYTPEQLPKRSFTPLFTSTPRGEDVDSSESDEEYCVPLTQCDSNTVATPELSSILTKNDSIMSSINKSRQQSVNLALDNERSQSYYKVCYDDTDEEEVVDDETQNMNQTSVHIREPTRIDCGDTHAVTPIDYSTLKTIVYDPNEFLTFTVQPNAAVHEDADDENDCSIDSSVYMGIERIDEYLRGLEAEIIVMRRTALDSEDARSVAASKRIKILEEQVLKIHETITSLKRKLGDNQSILSIENSFVEMNSSSFVGSFQNEPDVFDESHWAELQQESDFGGSSCDSSELVTFDECN